MMPNKSNRIAHLKKMTVFFLPALFTWQLSMSQSSLRHITSYKYGNNKKVYIRQYLSDSVFIEKYCYPISSDTVEYITTDTFKVVQGNWWYYLKGKFYPFFSVDSFNEGKITGRKYTLNKPVMKEC